MSKKKQVKAFDNSITLHRLYNELQYAEFYYLYGKGTRIEYLNKVKNKYVGHVKRELIKIINLKDQAELFISEFITEMIEMTLNPETTE